jgi:hypothetical protein
LQVAIATTITIEEEKKGIRSFLFFVLFEFFWVFVVTKEQPSCSYCHTEEGDFFFSMMQKKKKSCFIGATLISLPTFNL